MKKQYYFIAFLLLFTVIMMTKFWQFGMMGLTVFFLAYLTKGSRNIKTKNFK
jgi:maltodextrin utilization protein YvdJ